MADSLIVQISNLSKSFGSFTVLNDISINIERGENLVVFGRSGTGKSVLLKCTVGLLKPDQGTVKINGRAINKIPLKELNEARKEIGFLFQGAALYDSMSVRENLQFPLKRHFDMTQKEMVSLADAVDKMPSELSGGMRKRIGLARSIITDPKLMLYDEPTTGLDPISSKEISELIMTLQKKLSMTSIVVTHDLICAKIIADRVIFIRDGIIAHEGKIDELTKSSDPFLKNFFSTEIIND
jgi:phospholipid/cholesterol/gamma-HCH transport system ATP-binding protein